MMALSTAVITSFQCPHFCNRKRVESHFEIAVRQSRRVSSWRFVPLCIGAFPVAGVIAVAPHTFVEDLTIRSIVQAREDYRCGDLRPKLARYHDDVDSAFWGWNDIWLDPEFRAWNIEALLPSIKCPVFAVQGYEDEYGTMAQVEDLSQRIPHAKLLKLRDCGHSAHRDQPDALSRAAIDFVRFGDSFRAGRGNRNRGGRDAER